MRTIDWFGRRGACVMVLGIILMVAGCGVPGVVPTGHALPTAAPTATAPALPPVRLPQDEAPHKDLTEWWYYTGHFQGTDATGQAHTYGFELTFFQVLRGQIAPIYVGHYAVSDITRGQFQYDQRLLSEPNAVLPNGTTTTGFNLAIGNWTMQGVGGQDTLAASMADYTINLTLASQKPPALHNGNGLITYGIGGFSYYYSRTRMAVSGSVQDHGATIPVTGLAWMDHQWGNFLALGSGGWDWFSMQLANGVEDMVYVIRDAQGQIISSVGTRVGADGTASIIPAGQISQRVVDHWHSAATGVTYPSGWELTLPDGTFTVTPLVRDQELITTNTTGNTYWEGACSVTGTISGQPVNGQGYTELTGYMPAP